MKNAFHLANQVHHLAASRAFYGCGCPNGANGYAA